nr:hypothetical protein [uncultured Allomuricauda sp.]
MKTIRELEKIIDLKLEEKFKSIGYVLTEENIFTRLYHEGKESFIMINKTRSKTEKICFVNPLIGFVNYEVENIGQIVAPEFYGPGYRVNTITQSLGYFTKKREFMEWEFFLDKNPSTIERTTSSLVKTIKRFAIPKMELLSNDYELFQAMENNDIGLQITNRVKAPILLYVMSNKEEALNLVTKKLDELRPSKKDTSLEEPDNFKSVEEAWSFYRRDKDPRYYYNYLQFHNRFINYIKENR